MKKIRLHSIVCSSFLLLIFFFGVSAMVQAADSPKKWLETMAESTKTMTYRGQFVYQQGATLEALSVMHAQLEVDGTLREFERIQYQDGPPREMLRQGSVVTYHSHGRKPARFENKSLMPMIGWFSSAEFERSYQLIPASLGRVADRDVVQLMIIPKDQFRYGYQLWLDRKTGLVLKLIMLDKDGRIIERMQFTSIEFPAQLTAEEQKALKSRPAQMKAEHAVEEKANNGNHWGWQLGWMPGGFAMDSSGQRESPVSDLLADTRSYSDGLASFSVFVEPDQTRILSQASEQIGSMAAVSKVFRSGTTYFHVTVVGEIPLGVAERIAASVRPVEQEAPKSS